MATTLDYFSVIREDPNFLILSAKFTIDANENVRLINVDNSSLTVINCTYKIYDDIGKTTRGESRADGFTFQWKTVDATVNAILLDKNNNQQGNTISVNTSDAPIL